MRLLRAISRVQKLEGKFYPLSGCKVIDSTGWMARAVMGGDGGSLDKFKFGP